MIPSNEPILRSLARLRRRLRMQDFVAKLGCVALISGGVLAVNGAVNRWVFGRMPWDARFALWTGLSGLALALAWTFARRLPRREVAQIIDRHGATGDRFLSGLSFTEKGDAPEMRALALRECVGFVQSRDFRSLIRVRIPREAAWMLAPAAALAMLQWHARDALARRNTEEAAGKAEAAPMVAKLEQLALEAEKKAAQTDDAELKKLAEKLKQSAAQLRAEATGQEAAAKAAMQQLSELEQLVKDMQKAPVNVTPEELKKLAKEFEKDDATRPAAAAMQAGELAEAAKALEEAAKEEQPSPEQAQKALKQALERLAEQQQLSEALQKLRREMSREGGAGDGGSEALRKLAQMLRKMQPGAQGGQSAPGKSPSQQSLQDLLAALQNLKYGDENSGEGEPSEGQGEEGKGQVAVQSFGVPNAGDQPQAGRAQLPTGQPGSEHDTGTSDPFGDQAGDTAKRGEQLALKGHLGEGESLSASLAGGPDGSKSSRRYKELYEAMAPAAQEAVMQEEIPLGSRFFIKRYFESIRPRE